jgi:hypothetical protein
MKLIIALVLLTQSLVSAAQNSQIDLRGLSAEQIAELNLQAQKLRSPENISATVRREATAWADLGSNIGTAMVSAAKELGVAATEFSQTGLGKVVTAIIVYKVVGKEILGVIVGSAILVVGGILTIMIFKSTRFRENVKYQYVPVLWGMFNRRRVVEIQGDGDYVVGRCLVTLITAAVTLVIGLNCIF